MPIRILTARILPPLFMCGLMHFGVPDVVADGPSTTTSPAKDIQTFDVRQFGAVGDGKTNDAPAIQRAIDACAAAGGGVVRLPAGTYAGCGIRLKSHITFHLDAGAKLQGPPHATDYPPHVSVDDDPWSGKFDGVLWAERATDITVTGEGRIDGNGADSWRNEKVQKAAAIAAGKPPRAGSGVTQRPRLVQFSRCDQVTVTGITLSNSHQFHLVFSGCENVIADGLTIFAPSDSPETDGIDLRGAKHVQIRNCHIDNGDDEVAVKGGYRAEDRSTFICDDIEISHCTFLHGHGMSIGSDTAGNVLNVFCHDCTFEGTANGIRIKSMRDRGGTVEHARYENLTMTDVEEGIVINAYYRKPPKTDTTQPVTPLTPLFRDIRIRNVTGNCPKLAGMIVGLPEAPVSDVVLEDVKITAGTGMVIRNASRIVLKNVDIRVKKGEPVAIQDADVKQE